MRELILKDKWVSAGANFGTLGGAQCVADFGDVRRELNALRTTAALCDFSFSKIFEYAESDGIDFLDTKLAANSLKLRYGRLIDTFLADAAAHGALKTGMKVVVCAFGVGLSWGSALINWSGAFRGAATSDDYSDSPAKPQSQM